MRALIQRASEATVSVDGKVVGGFDRMGLVVLLGVARGDDAATARTLAEKVWRLRILPDGDPGVGTHGVGDRSAADVGAPLLVVSQFTLYADTSRGRRPSYATAAPAAEAELIVEAFVQALRDLNAEVTTGRFGAHMRLHLVNDGPVTILLEA